MHDRKRLLADVLAEAEPPGFREGLLSETLRLVGRRRRVRRLQRATAALVVLGLFGMVVWRFMRPGHPVVTPLMASYSIVHTEPLSTSAIISTQLLDANRFIVSVASVDLVRTTPTSGNFRNFDDDELLAFVAPRPAVLVCIGPREEKLVFVNLNDQKGFPVN